MCHDITYQHRVSNLSLCSHIDDAEQLFCTDRLVGSHNSAPTPTYQDHFYLFNAFWRTVILKYASGLLSAVLHKLAHIPPHLHAVVNIYSNDTATLLKQLPLRC